MNIIDQIPPSVEWRVYRGDSSNFSILLYDSEDNAIDLTGYSVFAQARVKPTSESAIASLGVTVNENVIVLTIPNTSVLPEQCYFDVEALDGVTGDNKTLVKGTIIREWDVTR
jgi:hypothetical protein